MSNPAALPSIAWIGLGIMGSPMAENLLKAAAYSVTGFTLEQDKLDRLAAMRRLRRRFDRRGRQGRRRDHHDGARLPAGRGHLLR